MSTYEDEKSQLYANGKKLAIRWNNSLNILEGFDIKSVSIEIDNNIKPVMSLGSRELFFEKGMQTIELDLHIVARTFKTQTISKDTKIWFKQQVEDLLTQAYKQINKRSKK